jgi:hypothetical protein
MYVIKIITISLILLLTAVSVNAQEEDSSPNETKVDSPAVVTQAQVFDTKGTNIADSNVAFASDTILKSDTTGFRGKKHTAVKAVLYSAALPGLGQAYNKKYWKIPIIYAGFGGLGYALYYTSHNFNMARDAYRKVVRGQYASYRGYTSSDDLKYFRDQYRNYLNISALVTVLWYGLNLIDAAVDGHLYSYNMDDKLSFNFDPSFHIHNEYGLNQTCLGLTFNIKMLGGKKKSVGFIQ